MRRVENLRLFLIYDLWQFDRVEKFFFVFVCVCVCVCVCVYVVMILTKEQNIALRRKLGFDL